MEDAAIGSSNTPTILGSTSSKVDLEIVILECFDPSKRAVSAASASSSPANDEPYPTV